MSFQSHAKLKICQNLKFFAYDVKAEQKYLKMKKLKGKCGEFWSRKGYSKFVIIQRESDKTVEEKKNFFIENFKRFLLSLRKLKDEQRSKQWMEEKKGCQNFARNIGRVIFSTFPLISAPSLSKLKHKNWRDEGKWLTAAFPEINPF